MKKAAIFLVCILYLLTLSGCGLVYIDDSKEKTAYNDAITSLFNALDKRDNEAIYNLFSPSVREQDEDLENQIDKLLSIYVGPTDEIGWDGLLAGGASYDYGKHSKNAFTSFPIPFNPQKLEIVPFRGYNTGRIHFKDTLWEKFAIFIPIPSFPTAPILPWSL